MADTQKDITLIYEGVDITEDVDIIECVCRDVSGGEADCLNLKVDHADRWFRWGPQKNDRIRVLRSGYDTKTLFLNTVVPEDGAYRIYATASKCTPFPKKWQAFEDKTIANIFNTCAGECGMTAGLFGVNGSLRYPYLLREDETAPAFLQRMARREGAALKALDGMYKAIGILYAQGLPAMHEMELNDDQMDSEYIDRRDLNWANLQIETPFGKGMARDANASGAGCLITDIAVEDDATAYRWARNLLLMHNRQSESLRIEMDFNPGYTAMVRIDVKSRTDADGQWIIDEVTQNLLDGRTKARMLRCVTGIG